MDNAKNPPVMALPFEMGYVRKILPVFRVGMWARDANGVICYIAQDLPAENAWSAVGRMMLHLRATDPRISIRPDGISVIRIPGERTTQPNDGEIIQ